MLGVFLDRDTVDRSDLDLTALHSVLPDWRVHAYTRPEQLAERLAEATVVVSNKVRLDAAAFAAAPQLRLVCVAATGTNNVDLDAAQAQGITVCNVRGYATPAVVQHVYALILALTTRLPEYQRDVVAGRWQASPYFCLLDHPIRELSGRTLGIVGYGELGSAVAQLAAAFGMSVLIAQRAGGPATGRAYRAGGITAASGCSQSALSIDGTDARADRCAGAGADETGCAAHQYRTRWPGG